MVSSREKLRRFSSPRFINVNINDVVRSTECDLFSDRNKLSAILRFDTFHGDVRYPTYRMLVLVDNKIYCYNKVSRRKVINFSMYSSIIEFDSVDDAVSSWKKYIRNEIV